MVLKTLEVMARHCIVLICEAVSLPGCPSHILQPPKFTSSRRTRLVLSRNRYNGRSGNTAAKYCVAAEDHRPGSLADRAFLASSILAHRFLTFPQPSYTSAFLCNLGERIAGQCPAAYPGSPPTHLDLLLTRFNMAVCRMASQHAGDLRWRLRIMQSAEIAARTA